MDDAYSHLKDFSLDEASGLPGTAWLAGDFYRENDDVTRGVTLGAALPIDDSFGLKHTAGGSCDFYAAPPVVRGLNLGSDLDFGLGADLLQPPGWDLSKSSYGDIPAPLQASAQNKRFSDGDTPLQTPTDPFFTFEITTLFVLCDRPASLMNCLLEFLTTEVVASISKVNPIKFCIKADVFIDHVMCTLKARGYQQEPGKVALEIQRRSGDAIAFAGIYQRASKHLQNNFAITAGMPQDSVGLLASPPPLLPQGKVDLMDYAPLLDMARQSHLPDLQAESAATLASLTADPTVVDALCSEPGPIQDIAKLLDTDRLDIALPAGTLVSNLAQSRNGMEHFDGMLEKLLEKVRSLPGSPGSNDASSQARRQFAKALAAGTQSCRQRLSEPMARQLAGEVLGMMSATQDAMGTDDSVYGNLQEAYFSLTGPSCTTLAY